MSNNKLLLAGLAFLGGAVLGRLVRLKPLLRGALMAAGFAGAPTALVRRPPSSRRAPRRRMARTRLAATRSRAA
jgi:hypothetical protein